MRLGMTVILVAASAVVVGTGVTASASTVSRPAAASPSAVRGNTVVQSVSAAAVIAPVATCASLTSDDLTNVPDAPATITSTKTITASTNPLGSYDACQIAGIIAPQTQFVMDLPLSTYQGRYLQLGCGGNCGSDNLGPPAASFNCTPVTSGQFAEATDNEGHVGTAFGSEFAQDPELRTIFGYKSEHQLSLVAKRIVADFYGQQPQYSYFDGCSEGGDEGLSEAQRYPDDFNGIIAGAPAAVWDELEIFYQGWNELANSGPGRQPILTIGDLGPLHQAVVAACDNLNGTTDGLIADPLACDWDPASIQCGAQQTSTPTDFCLTSLQVQTVRKLYSGPTDDRGTLMYPGWQVRGSELNWAAWLVPIAGDETQTIDYGIVNPWLKYGVFPNVEPQASDQNLTFTDKTFRAATETDSIYDSTDPNLSAFRAHGGKLILWHGFADPAISPVGTIAYFTAVQKYMGVSSTHSFARLFMLPGVSHCAGGDGPDSFNGLGALTDWVEGGQAPSQLTTFKVTNGSVTASRPVFEYPKIAVDTTGGPINDASSYTAQDPPKPFNGNLHWLGSFRNGYEKVCGWVNGKWVCRMAKSGL
ncbi:MAG TPA: tannase/feruloyl esterase family alpha/beta hydrolase [Micromonosporaceae bacterium]|nr:tannase/feruloyl esterase family alpha/beta hydrolase [Micromonosporaceae bacterium]